MNHSHKVKSVVIGGTSGIGKAVANSLEKRGDLVVIASRKNGFDMTDESAVAEYFAELGEFDHLVITAGSAAPGGKVADLDISDAKSGFDTKFWGSITAAKYAVKNIRPGGSITFTSGFLSRKTVPGTYVKTAMNAAIEATAKIMARELAPIRVNVVSPGLTDTEAYKAMDAVARSSMIKSATNSLPAGKVGEAEDLAQGYLMAIENTFMTGAVIDIDGGALVN